MKYSFSAQFLKVLPPETNFGDAWEALCHDLIVGEHPGEEILRLTPPDHGIDILRRSAAHAYQCKSDERGALGTLPPGPTIESITRAAAQQVTLGWFDYVLATNASYSGDGVVKILTSAAKLGLAKEHLVFRGPEYWSELCERHYARVQHRLDYRLTATEEEVREAFRKAGYYDRYIAAYMESIALNPVPVELGNNRTPIKLTIPFSSELTVEHLLDVGMALLNVTLDKQTYPDLATSAQPRVSITIKRFAKPFTTKLGELKGGTDELELWITTAYSDDVDDDTDDPNVLRRLSPFITEGGHALTNRRAETGARFDSYIQDQIWRGIDQLLHSRG